LINNKILIHLKSGKLSLTIKLKTTKRGAEKIASECELILQKSEVQQELQ